MMPSSLRIRWRAGTGAWLGASVDTQRLEVLAHIFDDRVDNVLGRTPGWRHSAACSGTLTWVHLGARTSAYTYQRRPVRLRILIVVNVEHRDAES